MAKERALGVKEICRQKLSVFYGSADLYEHGFKETLANGKDVINKHFDKGNLTITLSEDRKRLFVKDSGTGININQFDEHGDPLYKMYFETLFAGGNMDNAEEKIESVGCNGCGTCVLNHISRYFRVESAREGKIFEVLYIDGGVFQHFKEIGASEETYTLFEFELDPEVYKTVEYDVESLKDICKHNVAVDNKISLSFSYLNEVVEWHYNSIQEYFDENTSNKTCPDFVGEEKKYIDTYVDYDKNHNPINKEEETTVSCVFASSSELFQETYLNGNFLPANGTIYDGMLQGLRNSINKYCKNKKLLDKKMGNISKEDIQGSISFVCSVRSTRIDFQNQTKLSTSKDLYETRTKEYVQELVEVLQVEQPTEFEKLVKHVLEVKRFNMKAEDSRKKLKSKLSENINNITNRVEGLIDCKVHGEEAEIFIAEGQSALGSLLTARNPKFQAVIPIRGKVLNLLKASLTDVQSSAIIQGLVNAIGCGTSNKKLVKIFGEFVEKNLRYGKIFLATDRDDDGLDIICLLLTMFYIVCPELIYEGRIYIVLTPLYIVKLNDDTEVYWFSEEEHDAEIGKYKNIKSISRSKGLGSNTPEVMAKTGMNPETRKSIKVEVGDVEKMQEAFRVWRDTDVTERKHIIETELYKYKSID